MRHSLHRSRRAVLVALATLALAGAPIAGAAVTRHPALRAAAVGPVLLPATGAEIAARATRPGPRATLVNVWATWCAPCRMEFPAMLRIARAHRAEGLRLVLVSTDFLDQRAAARRFLAARGVTDTSWIKHDGDMSFIQALHPEWSGALPATLVYDGRGRLTDFWEGAADSERFERAVRKALAADPTPPEASR